MTLPSLRGVMVTRRVSIAIAIKRFIMVSICVTRYVMTAYDRALTTPIIWQTFASFVVHIVSFVRRPLRRDSRLFSGSTTNFIRGLFPTDDDPYATVRG